VGAPTQGGDVQQCATIASECTVGTLIDQDYGWLCRDMPDTEADAAVAWTKTTADPNAAP